MSLCQNYSEFIRFQFASESAITPMALAEKWRWQGMQFTEETRLQAELVLLDSSTKNVFSQDFIVPAAQELLEKACQLAVPESVLVMKHLELHCFQRLLPLPINAEAQFHIMRDNKNALKSVIRLYQDGDCASEIIFHVDLHSKEEANRFICDIGEKSFKHFSDHSINY